MNLAWIVVLMTLSMASAALADSPISQNTNNLERIELADQSGVQHQIPLRSDRPTVIVVADRKGSEQVTPWIELLKSEFAGKIAITGVADVRGVPGILRERIRRRFREKFTYPILLDWTGETASRLGVNRGEVTVLVYDATGVALARYSGPSREPMRGELVELIRRELNN